jgi:hypothetical protein
LAFDKAKVKDAPNISDDAHQAALYRHLDLAPQRSRVMRQAP